MAFRSWGGWVAVGLTLIAAILTFLGGMLRRGCEMMAVRGQPPNWVFSVIWPLLFVFIAIAGYRIFSKTISVGRRIAFITILFLLALYPVVAWGLCSSAFGTLIIVMTILFLLMLMVAMIGKDAWSIVLLLPLLLWLSYATILSYRSAKVQLSNDPSVLSISALER